MMRSLILLNNETLFLLMFGMEYSLSNDNFANLKGYLCGMKITTTKRLASLDILRGFVLFLLVFLQPVLAVFGYQTELPWLNDILYHFEHAEWEGFRFWDLVMPLFLFMTGASMPFSFAKYKYGEQKGAIYRKVLSRFLILFILGLFAQGNILAFDLNHIYLYNNTLQAIASGYLIASLFLINCSIKHQVLGTIALLVIYWIPMAFWGDYTPEGNFAYHVDRAVLGRFMGDPSYTWIWSSLNFGATVMLGTFAGRIIKDGKRVTLRLVVIGIGLICLGLLWNLQIPIIKRLWTSSMVLYAGGWSFLIMALFYYVIDQKKLSRGLNWLKVYGMNSITAYMLGILISFRSVADSLFFGLEQYLGSFYTPFLTLCNYLIIYGILALMYRHKIFVKI